MTRTAVLICPGRGTYNAPELGYLSRHFPDTVLLDRLDAIRAEAGQPTLRALDGAERFTPSLHTRGDTASALIYAATLGDVLALADVEIVAVTGNSMGWYSTLAAAGALTVEDGFRVANTMGTLMQEHGTGGQLVYPFMPPTWEDAPDQRKTLLDLVDRINADDPQSLALSIELGGMLVIAGTEAGLTAFEAEVPRIADRFPLRLRGHAAFHTPLLRHVAEMGQEALDGTRITQPAQPMIDGRGHVWWPGSSDLTALWDYTLGHQVTETYDFTRAITAAAREFAPDMFLIAGPGTTLTGAVTQSLIRATWKDVRNKADVAALPEPLTLTMGDPAQRATVTRQ
ncbi:ACP S-malonyltransferase [Pseudaestuariivita sp.]|uniref:ACP S-malonyltransferase n=1 Tax=Pseudaestuariivita sp. TaxID=2211669 RepID=UPI00405A345A